MLRSVATITVLLCTALPAQAIVVPAAYTNADAGSAGELPGFTGRFRMQVLVDGTALQGITGQSIHALWLRRGRLLGHAFPSSSAQLRVTASHASTTPRSAAAAFAANHGAAAATVFDGILTLPASLPTEPPYPWQSPFAARIDFAPAFAYAGGPLCLEFQGAVRATPGTQWPIDYVQEVNGSTVQKVGAPCGDTTTRISVTANSRARNLMPGGSFFVSTFGEPGAAAFLALGSAPTQIPLAAFGAPQCTLHVQPQATLAYVFPTWPGAVDAEHTLTLQLPNSTGLLNALFYAQAIHLETPGRSNGAGLTTTNGLAFRVGSVPPPATMTVVATRPVAATAPWPTSGNIYVSRGPVLRFEAQ